MGAFTKLFNLFKPDYTDKPDIVKAVAENMDKIDAAIGGKQNDLGIKNIGDNLTLDPNTGVLDAKAQKITVDTALSATSGNPIANKAVNTEITNLGSRIDTLDNNLTIIQRRTRKDITSLVKNGTFSKAIKERNLEKYGTTIGDYFVGPSGYTYHLGDRSPYYGAYSSYAVVNIPHVGIVVDTHTTHRWHSGDASTVGYNGCELHAYLKGTVLSTIESDIASLTGESYDKHLIAHQKLLSTALANRGWKTDQYISALTEMQIYGTDIWSANGYQDGEACRQLEIFRKFLWNEIFENATIWLRNMSTNSIACVAHNRSYIDNSTVTSENMRVVGLILFC